MALPDSRLSNVVPLHRSGELPDSALVLAAREGERWATEALFRRHVKRAMGLAYRLMPEQDPEDVVQEAFIKAFAQLKQLDKPSSFGSWLLSVVVSLVRMRLRTQRWMTRLGFRSEEPIEPDSLVAADAPLEVRAEVREVYGWLNRLTAEQRVALVLQRVEGLELQQIAEQMKISVSSVKRRVAEADAALAEVRGHE